MRCKGLLNKSANCEMETDLPSRLTATVWSSWTAMHALMEGMLSFTFSMYINSAVSTIVNINPLGNAVSLCSLSRTSATVKFSMSSAVRNDCCTQSWCHWDERCDAAFVVYAIPIPSVRLSVTRVDCGHTVRPIETILVSLESPNILVSEKIRMVYIGHPKPNQILGRMGSGSGRTHCAPPFPVYDMHYVDPLAGPHSI